MKKLYASLGGVILLFSGLNAQTLHDVSVSNFSFTPGDLLIEAGDTVRWTNIGGNHNVNGTTATFPNNPESFGNELSSENWVYEFVFTETGTYNYRCDLHPGPMQGSVIVSEPVSVRDVSDQSILTIFPNPVVETLYWKSEQALTENAVLIIFDALGKKVSEINIATANQLDVSSFSKGMYTYTINRGQDILQSGKFLIAD